MVLDSHEHVGEVSTGEKMTETDDSLALMIP